MGSICSTEDDDRKLIAFHSDGKKQIFGDQKVFVGQYEFSDDDYYNIALGEGQFGKVYKIEDRKNSKLQFAVKVIDIEKFKMQTKKI